MDTLLSFGISNSLYISDKINSSCRVLQKYGITLIYFWFYVFKEPPLGNITLFSLHVSALLLRNCIAYLWDTMYIVAYKLIFLHL